MRPVRSFQKGAELSDKGADVELARQRIYQGDCVQLLDAVEKGSVDLVFADPPFNIGYKYDVYDDKQQAEDYLNWCRRWIQGVFQALKPNGTFWLAIGDEFAAELKIEAQRTGFHCRSWVIWYYTFGVNCVNGFSRSHTHLFHFVKDKTDFTFNRFNPQIRVKSARQLVYADGRANPNGRLPDNTWITRPQDAPLSFSPNHDTWYFARVAGTFKEREGFHGCQMPEQLLGRIVRASSHPQDLVLDPFAGSGTTLCVAKKLGRQWMGFELSEEYARYIQERLANTRVGDPLDGAADPIQSAPSTANGKRRGKSFDEQTDQAVIAAYQSAGQGYPADYILCNPELNKSFISACKELGLGGSAVIWNRYLLRLRKAGKLPKASRRPEVIPAQRLGWSAAASEIAWRLLEIDYRKSLDDILCTPEFAGEFDRLAAQYGPSDSGSNRIELYRRAALATRKRMKSARKLAADRLSDWPARKRLSKLPVDAAQQRLPNTAGVFVLCHEGSSIFACDAQNMREQLQSMLEVAGWQALQPDSILYAEQDAESVSNYGLKACIIEQERPLLNLDGWTASTTTLAS